MTAARHLILSITTSCLMAATMVRGAEPQPRHLFLDPSFLTETEGAALHVNPPERRETVIRPDRPWEQLMITFFLTVRDEGGKLRMWYVCRDKANRPNVAYAESTDGVQWTKPDLGIVDYDGSTKNNLTGLTSLEGVVFQDPNAPPAERYAYVTHAWLEGLVRFHSPDGLHWQRDEKALIRFGSDTQNVTFWDARLGKYVLYLRGWFRGVDQKVYRRVLRAELPDLKTPVNIDATKKDLRFWGPDKPALMNDEFPPVFAADEKDPPNCDVYNISAQPYPPDPQWYVGFPSMFQRDKRVSDGRLELHFTGSHDGVHWERYDRTPYVRVGLEDSDSAGMVFMGTGMVVRGDEIWQYGTGFRSHHGDKAAREKRTDGVIYRYVQRLDGFVSLDLEQGGGEAETQPVTVTGARLQLNVDATALANLQVGLLDEAGHAIEGFNVEDADIIRSNATGVVVTWKGSADISKLMDRKVRLKFAGTRARIFSFRFESASPTSP